MANSVVVKISLDYNTACLFEKLVPRGYRSAWVREKIIEEKNKQENKGITLPKQEIQYMRNNAIFECHECKRRTSATPNALSNFLGNDGHYYCGKCIFKHVEVVFR